MIHPSAVAKQPRTPTGQSLVGLGGFEGHFAGCPNFRVGGECSCTLRLRKTEDEARAQERTLWQAALQAALDEHHGEHAGPCPLRKLLQRPED